ncbi:MAG: CatB-related O-acetyltransferase [Pseudomonadota bacterium]
MIDGWPDPTDPYPIRLPDGSAIPGTVHLSALPMPDNFQVGAHSYASDFDPPAEDGWANRLAPYLFPFSKERLVIGRFCQIAHGVRFITASANHATDGLTCYPFAVFDTEARAGFQPDRRDTVIGHDVWFGMEARVLPGARIGNGAIIGAGAVIRGDVPPYAIVTGNPGRVVRFRFAPETVARLQALAWWDWPDDTIASARCALQSGDIDALSAMQPTP